MMNDLFFSTDVIASSFIFLLSLFVRILFISPSNFFKVLNVIDLEVRSSVQASF